MGNFYYHCRIEIWRHTLLSVCFQLFPTGFLVQCLQRRTDSLSPRFDVLGSHLDALYTLVTVIDPSSNYNYLLNMPWQQRIASSFLTPLAFIWWKSICFKSIRPNYIFPLFDSPIATFSYKIWMDHCIFLWKSMLFSLFDCCKICIFYYFSSHSFTKFVSLVASS